MKKKKILATVMSLALVLVVAVGGTLAFLSDETETLTNTFSVGPGYVPEEGTTHQGLWVDEINWATYDPESEGEPERIEEVGNQYLDLLPGSLVIKDPTFHMTAGSVKSRVVMKIVGLDTLNANHFTISYNEITYTPDSETGKPAISPTSLNVGTTGTTWKKIANLDGTTENRGANLDGYYLYNEAVDASESEQQVDLEPLFNYIELDKNVTDEQFEDIQAAINTTPSHQIMVGGVATQWDNTNELDTLGKAVELLDDIHASASVEP